MVQIRKCFLLNELIDRFSIERISKAGAKFDFEKAKWYNHEWIKNAEAKDLLQFVKDAFTEQGIPVNSDAYLEKVIDLIKDRCTLLTDFVEQSKYFFISPQQYDLDAVKPKWTNREGDIF